MLTDVLGLLFYAICIYPLILFLLAIRLHRYRPRVDHYCGLLFIPWVVVLSVVEGTNNILVLLGAPIAVAFLFNVGWLLQTANGEFLGLPKEAPNVPRNA